MKVEPHNLSGFGALYRERRCRAFRVQLNVNVSVAGRATVSGKDQLAFLEAWRQNFLSRAMLPLRREPFSHSVSPYTS